MRFTRVLATAALALASIVATNGVANGVANASTVYHVDAESFGVARTAAIEVDGSTAHIEFTYTNATTEAMTLSVYMWTIGPAGSSDLGSGRPVIYVKGSTTSTVPDYVASITCTDPDVVLTGHEGGRLEPGETVRCTSTDFTWSGPVPGQRALTDSFRIDGRSMGTHYGAFDVGSLDRVVASEPAVSALDGTAVSQVRVGDQVRYSFAVTNTGVESTTATLSASDDLGLSYTCDQQVLEPAESTVCHSGVYTVLGQDAVDGVIATTATLSGATATNSALSASVTLPALTLLAEPTSDPTVTSDPTATTEPSALVDPTATADPTGAAVSTAPSGSTAAPTAQGGALAATGANAAQLALVAVLAMAGGAIAVIAARRRFSAQR